MTFSCEQDRTRGPVSHCNTRAARSRVGVLRLNTIIGALQPLTRRTRLGSRAHRDTGTCPHTLKKYPEQLLPSKLARALAYVDLVSTRTRIMLVSCFCFYSSIGAPTILPGSLILGSSYSTAVVLFTCVVKYAILVGVRDFGYFC